jgi:hypothetical protein
MLEVFSLKITRKGCEMVFLNPIYWSITLPTLVAGIYFLKIMIKLSEKQKKKGVAPAPVVVERKG